MRAEIAGGRWDERLPAARVLARRLGVSPPTVAAAMLKLAGEGLLEAGGQRRAFRLAGPKRASSGAAGAGDSKHLLILTADELGELGELSRRLLERLRDEMTRKGWRVDYQAVDFLHVKRPQRAWNRLIQVEPGTSVIALYGGAPLAEWAVHHKVRILFLGGNSEGLPVPMVAVKSTHMAAVALARLTALGHWRIVTPLCDRSEAFKAGMRDVMRQAIEAAGQTYLKTYHNPESNYMKPDVTWRMLESAFANYPPTALVLFDWKELVTAYCFLASKSLRVPEDVSLILLSDQLEAEWFHPKLTRFRFPVRRLIRTMARWLEDGDSTAEQISLPADHIEGATIGPVRERT
jgi:DNA-binding LacI/PurR family transcriptional regulator